MHKLNMFVCSQSYYLNPFIGMFNEVNSIKNADVVMFTGGEDVSPALYDEPIGVKTGCHPARDNIEKKFFAYTEEEYQDFLKFKQEQESWLE